MITERTDVCVIAGGPSGLAAAISAAENGADVILLEKTARCGGAGNMAMGLLGIDTEETRNAGCAMTVKDAYNAFMDYTHYRCDSRLVLAYLSRSGDTIRWLKDMGVRFNRADRYFPGSQPTWHLVTPPPGLDRAGHAAVMMKKMEERAVSLGVKILCNTEAVTLEKEDGCITAVRALSHPDSSEIRIECGAAVLCTGGFGGDKEKVAEKTGLAWGKDISYISLPFSQGDGLRMAMEAGAMEDRENIEIMYTKPGKPCSVSHCLWRQPRALVLNRNGERVFNEELLENTTFAGNSILEQPGKRVFSIIDSNILDYYRSHERDLGSNVWADINPDDFIRELKGDIENGIENVYIAGSIEELSGKTGIRADALTEAIEEYNCGCESGKDMFFKDGRHLTPLTGPEYYVIEFTAGGYGTLGGIKINHRTEVLDKDFRPIRGLYAAGTDACSIFGDSYCFILPGNTLGFCVNSGRIAGESSAEYVKSVFKK